jgi:glycosyltransferase involved in cell wall biosynthesis
MKSSFIATVFNEEKNIESFLNSILSQTKSPDEIVIVDGGSTDDTYNILKKYSKKNKIIKIYQEKGANIARGRNVAVKNSKGDIILVSDAGCIIDKNWVKETLSYFPKEDVVAGSYKALSKNNFEFFQGLITIKKVDRPSRMSSRNVAFKKKCFEKVGGYPEKSLTGEDNRLMINFIQEGYRVAVNPKRRVCWEMRPTLSKFFKQYYLYGRGDRIQGNLLKKSIKKNFVMILGFWAYFLVLLASTIFYPIAGLILLIAPLIVVCLYSFKYLVKSGRPSALFWVPLLILSKRLGYILGATFK